MISLQRNNPSVYPPGKLAEAAFWAETHGLHETEAITYVTSAKQMTYVRLLMVQGRWEDAAALLDRLLYAIIGLCGSCLKKPCASFGKHTQMQSRLYTPGLLWPTVQPGEGQTISNETSHRLVFSPITGWCSITVVTITAWWCWYSFDFKICISD